MSSNGYIANDLNVLFQMGFVASLPFLLKAIVGPLGGVLADIMRNGYMSTANVRRVFYTVGKRI